MSLKCCFLSNNINFNLTINKDCICNLFSVWIGEITQLIHRLVKSFGERIVQKVRLHLEIKIYLYMFIYAWFFMTHCLLFKLDVYDISDLLKTWQTRWRTSCALHYLYIHSYVYKHTYNEYCKLPVSFFNTQKLEYNHQT